MTFLSDCHDCGAKPGEMHKDNCDVERCSVCGGQRLCCDCEGHDKAFARWTGIWPGKAEAQYLGVDLNEFVRGNFPRVFFIKPVPKPDTNLQFYKLKSTKTGKFVRSDGALSGDDNYRWKSSRGRVWNGSGPLMASFHYYMNRAQWTRTGGYVKPVCLPDSWVVVTIDGNSVTEMPANEWYAARLVEQKKRKR